MILDGMHFYVQLVCLVTSRETLHFEPEWNGFVSNDIQYMCKIQLKHLLVFSGSVSIPVTYSSMSIAVLGLLSIPHSNTSSEWRLYMHWALGLPLLQAQTVGPCCRCMTGCAPHVLCATSWSVMSCLSLPPHPSSRPGEESQAEHAVLAPCGWTVVMELRLAAPKHRGRKKKKN